MQDFDANTGKYSAVNTPPINALDNQCLQHDVEYTVHGDKKERQKADKKLIQAAQSVLDDPEETHINKLNASLVANLFRKKIEMDL